MNSENQELRAVGLKVTLPRVKILQILEKSETKHLSAEDVKLLGSILSLRRRTPSSAEICHNIFKNKSG